MAHSSTAKAVVSCCRDENAAFPFRKEGIQVLAAVFEGNGQLMLQDRPKPVLRDKTEVLVKVTAVGICGTDLHILQVPPAHPARKGCILGHEFAGLISEIGSDVSNFGPGDTVLIDPHPPCGVCRECRRGQPDRCEPLLTSAEPGHPNTIGIFSDGAMASHVVVPQHALYKIGSEVPPYLAALAEPLACVVSATGKLKIQPGETAVILGAGPIGLLFLSLFKANGASKIIVSEISKYRRQAAIDCGATRVIDPNHESIESAVKMDLDGGADVVVEAVGPLLDHAIRLVRPGGRVLQFGHDELAHPALQVAEIVRNEVSIFGAFIGKFSFERVARILESGILPLDRVVSHRLPLSKVHEGIQLLQRGEAIKVILHPEDS
jgi:threonine dehydrogenase-like Zn-dependent dehydrogenase